MRNIAQRLTAYETRGSKAASRPAVPAAAVCEKLRAHLEVLLGNTGFRELISCALTRAHAEVPWLRVVRVKTDGSLEGLGGLPAGLGRQEIGEGGVELLAQLLGLLAAFIGEGVTFRQVHEVWPDIPLNDLNSRRRTADEESK